VRLAFVADPPEQLDAGLDTTVGLVRAAQSRGHQVWITETSGLAVVGGRAQALLRPVQGTPGDDPAWFSPAGDPRWLPLDRMDAVFMRTDPPVGTAYLHATYILDSVDPTRTTMVNDPRGIRQANEKLFALRFPELIPPTLVSADAGLIAEFVHNHGMAVVKPIDGHAGRGVLQLRPDDPNLASMVELATDYGRTPTVVQAYLDSVTDGNKRLFVVGGEVTGAVIRFPGPGDFRIGPPAELTAVTATDTAMVARLAPALRHLGLWLVGIDVIGDRLIEVNVTSPGAITKTDVAFGTGLADDVIARLESARSVTGTLVRAPVRSRHPSRGRRRSPSWRGPGDTPTSAGSGQRRC